jgi:hypothetical protein
LLPNFEKGIFFLGAEEMIENNDNLNNFQNFIAN